MLIPNLLTVNITANTLTIVNTIHSDIQFSDTNVLMYAISVPLTIHIITNDNFIKVNSRLRYFYKQDKLVQADDSNRTLNAITTETTSLYHFDDIMEDIRNQISWIDMRLIERKADLPSQIVNKLLVLTYRQIYEIMAQHYTPSTYSELCILFEKSLQ